ncbi:MAG TPA: type II toxin-antitoxin system prevent-host-death family antitoxin [Vicinamibacterales bacterium]
MPRHAGKRPMNIHEAKTSLSKLIERAEGGEEIVIARAGRPVAKLVALKKPYMRRELGWLDGQFRIPDDFNRALPESVLRTFEGRKK